MNADRVENDLPGSHGDHEDNSGINEARSAVRCRSARVSAAVSPANNATFPMGSIVVQRVAKSLLILIRSGDICRKRAFYPDPNDESSTREVLGTAATIQRFNASTIHVATASFVRCEIQRKNAPGSGSCADSWYFASELPA